MEVRSLARTLRARPSPWLLSSRQQPVMLQRPLLSRPTNGIRYSSSDSSQSAFDPSEPSTTTTTTTEQTTTTTPTDQSVESTNEPNPPPQEITETTIPKPKSDLDNILNNLDLGSRTRPTTPTPTAKKEKSQSIRRIFPDSKQFLSQAVKQSATTPSASEKWKPPKEFELKLGPTLGRQVLVMPERGVDTSVAIRNLETTLKTHKVKQQSISQKFHVRRGLMRKQLKMSRWRKLFRVSFLQTVRRIQRMRAQGW